MNKVIYILGFLLVFCCTEADAQFYQIEIKVDSSRKSPVYKNENPRGIKVDANTRSTGNYKRGFFPNQKVIGVINNEKKDSLKLKKLLLKKEDDEK
jgi:hypothetical protein